MKTKRVIKRSNLPMSSPIMSGLVMYLALDKWNVPGWVWGAVGLLYLKLLIGWIVETIRQKDVDILQNEFRTKADKAVSDFASRLEERAKK